MFLGATVPHFVLQYLLNPYYESKKDPLPVLLGLILKSKIFEDLKIIIQISFFLVLLILLVDTSLSIEIDKKAIQIPVI